MKCDKINLKKGSKGEEVIELQKILQSKGLYGGKIDGDYGNLTINAVKLLQRQQGNTEDGQFGPKTCKKLQSTTTHTTTDNIASFEQLTKTKFLKNDIQNAAKTYRTHIKNNKNYPNYLQIKDNNGKIWNVGKAMYMGIFEDMSGFFIKNGRLPNYVVPSHTSNNPLVMDYQNTSYTCGPTSLSMCAQMLALWISEQTLAKQAGTTSNGTGPDTLIEVAGKNGMNMKSINRNYTAVQKAINEGSPVLMHIHSRYAGGRSCLGYIGNFGHYIMCYAVKNNNYYLCDPTRGFKVCSATSIDAARSGTHMKYYRIDPQ